MKVYLKQIMGKFASIMKIMVEFLLIQTDIALAIVADGMGGHRAGDVASAMTIDLLKEMLGAIDQIETADKAEEWLRAML